MKTLNTQCLCLKDILRRPKFKQYLKYIIIYNIKRYHITQQFHSWVYIWKKWKYYLKWYMHPDVAKIWKQPKGPPADEWIKKMWSTCTRKHCSATKGWNFVVYINTGGLEGFYTKRSKSKKDKYCMISLNVESKKKYSKPVLVIKKQAHRHRECYQGHTIYSTGNSTR